MSKRTPKPKSIAAMIRRREEPRIARIEAVGFAEFEKTIELRNSGSSKSAQIKQLRNVHEALISAAPDIQLIVGSTRLGNPGEAFKEMDSVQALAISAQDRGIFSGARKLISKTHGNINRLLRYRMLAQNQNETNDATIAIALNGPKPHGVVLRIYFVENWGKSVIDTTIRGPAWDLADELRGSRSPAMFFIAPHSGKKPLWGDDK